MRFVEILQRVKGRPVLINNIDERRLVDVDEDFLVLQGGNPQMRITEFVPLEHVVRVTRADYAAGQSTVGIDLAFTGGDQERSTPV